MRFEEYLGTLPDNLISGEDVALSERSLRDIFKLVNLSGSDTLYHLGCGDEKGVRIAVDEFGARRATGIDINESKIAQAQEALKGAGAGARLVCQDVTQSDISDATVVVMWFTDEGIMQKMAEKFRSLQDGVRIVTIWGPLPGCLPDTVDFPYIVNKTPLRDAGSIQEQLLAVLGVGCVDFATAWEFAERYTKALAAPGVSNDRFLTIMQTLTIWINAKNLGVACGGDVPESIRTYISIMKMHFDIDFGHLLPEE